MGRGRHLKTLQRMDAVYQIAEARRPITVRGIAYGLFTQGVIPSMGKAHTQMVSRVVTNMREDGLLPWHWVVDDGRPQRQAPTWADPEDFMESVLEAYRKDYWTQQPYEVCVWSEKSTVHGVLAPVLRKYAVPFQAHKGFSSATAVYNAAQATRLSSSEYKSILLYVGDYDPSGLNMSMVDLPERLDRYGGEALIRRIALTPDDGTRFALPSFPVEDKRTDPRFKWWVKNNFGPRCWELDAMDPNMLRLRVEQAIMEYVDPIAWNRCEVAEQAERGSMTDFFGRYPILEPVPK